MFSPRHFICKIAALLVLSFLAQTGAGANEQMARGATLFAEKCMMCHQPSGQGAPPIYPPLAQSDWMLADRTRAIKVICEGLAGTIVVNGQTYTNSMPAQILDDGQVADVLTYVFNSWGNSGDAFSAEEVRDARAKTRFPTYDALVAAAAYQPLPQAPDGWKVREVTQLPEFCTRMASDGTGKFIYVLQQTGGVYTLELASAALLPSLKAEEYLDLKRGEVTALGCTVGPDRHLWIVTNQKLDHEGPWQMNEVAIWRSNITAEGMLEKPQRWFTTSYPHGDGGYNHGVSHIAFGRDGLLYLSSGSRTDGGEAGNSARSFKGGEVEITACMWRMDPKSEKPQVEVIASGIRNAYGFAWNADGQLFTVSNGPNADAPEEMDAIVPKGHYGFPYQFAEWPSKPGHPYPHTPAPPGDLSFLKPVANLGPAAGGKPGGLFTFDAHSSPAGMIWCDDGSPPLLRGCFVITRFGNLLETPEDVGFDVLTARMSRREDGDWEARVERLLAPLGRPIDVHPIGEGRLLILEYTRTTNFKDRLGWLPGRIIELAPE